MRTLNHLKIIKLNDIFYFRNRMVRADSGNISHRVVGRPENNYE